MTDDMDLELDRLMSEALAPPKGPADRAFVVRVDCVIAEAERYRLWRARLWRQLATEGLALAAVAGSFAFIAQIAEVRGLLAETPGLIWPALVALLLFWGLVRGKGSALA